MKNLADGTEASPIGLGSAFLFIAAFGLIGRIRSKNDEKVHIDKAATIRQVFRAAKRRFRTFLKSHQYSDSNAATTSLSADRTLNFNHQVAGHTSEVLRGFLGKVLKPMVKGNLFLRELRLYEELAESPFSDYCNHLPRAFVPSYFGLALVETRTDPNLQLSTIAVDEEKKHAKKQDMEQALFVSFDTECNEVHKRGGLYALLLHLIQKIFFGMEDTADNSNFDISQLASSHEELIMANHVLPHLVLEDLTLGYCTPCVIDIKMGQQTFEPTASPYKKHREVLKCPYQAITGFRITGMKVFNIRSQTFMYKEKQFGRPLAPCQLCDGLAFFFHNGVYLRRDVVISVIQQLEQILVWFQGQNQLHFYCSSLLIIYDGSPSILENSAKFLDVETGNDPSTLPLQSHNSSAASDLVKVKMIDFAHTLPSPGGIDHGYILGLRNLITRLREVLQKY